MKLRNLAFILLLAAPLAACDTLQAWVGSGSADTQVGTSAGYVCASAAFGLEGAREAFDLLSDEAKGHITHAATILNPVCSLETRPTLDSAAQAALGIALQELTASLPTGK